MVHIISYHLDTSHVGVYIKIISPINYDVLYLTSDRDSTELKNKPHSNKHHSHYESLWFVCIPLLHKGPFNQACIDRSLYMYCVVCKTDSCKRTERECLLLWWSYINVEFERPWNSINRPILSNFNKTYDFLILYTGTLPMVVAHEKLPSTISKATSPFPR